MFVSINEAAKLVGKSRATIYSYIKRGKLSKNADNKLDIAELRRVFGEFVQQDVKTASNQTSEPNTVKHLTDIIELLKRELEQARQREQKLLALIEHQKESTFDKVLNLFKK